MITNFSFRNLNLVKLKQPHTTWAPKRSRLVNILFHLASLISTPLEWMDKTGIGLILPGASACVYRPHGKRSFPFGMVYFHG